MLPAQNDVYVNNFLGYCTNINNKYLIAMDFDGTMSKSLFPHSAKCGSEVMVDLTFWIEFHNLRRKLYSDEKDHFITEVSVVDIIKHWIAKGDEFILWTCRTSTMYNTRDALQDAVDWAQEHGIKFIAHNKNHPAVSDDPRKILVDRVMDDNAIDVTNYSN